MLLKALFTDALEDCVAGIPWIDGCLLRASTALSRSFCFGSCPNFSAERSSSSLRRWLLEQSINAPNNVIPTNTIGTAIAAAAGLVVVAYLTAPTAVATTEGMVELVELLVRADELFIIAI